MEEKHTCPVCKSAEARMEKIDGSKVCVHTDDDQKVLQFRCDKCGVTAITLRLFMIVKD